MAPTLIEGQAGVATPDPMKEAPDSVLERSDPPHRSRNPPELLHDKRRGNGVKGERGEVDYTRLPFGALPLL